MLISSGQTELHCYRNGQENRVEEELSNDEHFANSKMNGGTFSTKIYKT